MVRIETRPRAAHEVPLLTATANHIIEMEDTIMALGSSGTPAAIEKSPLDFANENPPPSTLGGKSLAAIKIEAGSAVTAPATQETPVSDPEPLSYAEPRPTPKQDIAQSSKKVPVVKDPDSEKSTPFTYMVVSPGSIYQSGAKNVELVKAQVTGEERIKAAFEKFKKYEDDKIEKRCAEMDTRLDALSIDISEE
ncbi:hypothetical protein Tco_1480650, partial [Tanacetum coccineum]